MGQALYLFRYKNQNVYSSLTLVNRMPYKDPKKARQSVKKSYIKIRNDPKRLARRRERQKIWMREWRKEHLERARQLCRESQKRNYDKNEHSAYIRNWRKNNPYNYERYKEQDRQLEKMKRLKAIKLLGSKCINCGISDVRVLEGHHINGIKNDRFAKRWWRHSNEIKDKIILLCSNCHIIKHYKEGE